MADQPSRAHLGWSAMGLFGLGVFFLQVLVVDQNDNAYGYLAVVGGALTVTAVPFAVAALVPTGPVRKVIARVAFGLVALVGLVGGVLLLLSVLLIPSQSYGSNAILVGHVVGLLALIGALSALVTIYRPGSRWRRR
jgi:Kef-type K+ transport system membrane component KefB